MKPTYSFAYKELLLFFVCTNELSRSELLHHCLNKKCTIFDVGSNFQTNIFVSAHLLEISESLKKILRFILNNLILFLLLTLVLIFEHWFFIAPLQFHTRKLEIKIPTKLGLHMSIFRGCPNPSTFPLLFRSRRY